MPAPSSCCEMLGPSGPERTAARSQTVHAMSGSVDGPVVDGVAEWNAVRSLNRTVLEAGYARVSATG